MSRFADTTNTKVVPLGACQCPGTPHSRDEVTVLTELGYEAMSAIGTAGWVASGGVMYIRSAANLKLLELGIVDWNFLGADGQRVRPSPASIGRLLEDTIDVIVAELETAATPRTLPNDSGAPSADGSPESASQTPETEPTTTSTTS